MPTSGSVTDRICWRSRSLTESSSLRRAARLGGVGLVGPPSPSCPSGVPAWLRHSARRMLIGNVPALVQPQIGELESHPPDVLVGGRHILAVAADRFEAEPVAKTQDLEPFAGDVPVVVVHVGLPQADLAVVRQQLRDAGAGDLLRHRDIQRRGVLAGLRQVDLRLGQPPDLADAPIVGMLVASPGDRPGRCGTGPSHDSRCRAGSVSSRRPAGPGSAPAAPPRPARPPARA